MEKGLRSILLCICVCLDLKPTFPIEFHGANSILSVHNPEALAAIRTALHFEPVDALHLPHQGLAILLQ